jgi:hypothetical protein
MSPNQAQIIEKVRRAGCLSAAELQALQDFSENWEARLKIDQLDYRWSEDVPSHIIQVRTNGFSSYHLPKSGSSKVTAGMGIFGILYGLIGMPLMVGSAGMVGGVILATISAFVVFRSKGEKQRWLAYDADRRDYYAKRQAALQVLPEELHPANRVCLHCVNPIT